MNTVDRLRIVMCFNLLTAVQANENANSTTSWQKYFLTKSVWGDKLQFSLLVLSSTSHEEQIVEYADKIAAMEEEIK